MIEVRSATFNYDGRSKLFTQFDWKVERGEAWAIIGPSGCGKTTLLYLLAGLRRLSTGTIRVAGETIKQPRPSTGLILQDFGLLPWATALENAVLGLKIRGISQRRCREIGIEWLGRLDLSAQANHYPSQLSGGQRQRVAIARTLALDPDVLLMDEPFSALDALTREGLQDLIVELGVEGTVTTVLVTHNIEEAVFLGRKILVLPLPPVASASVVINPGAGELGYRGQPVFHEKCGEVRRLVEGLRAENATRTERVSLEFSHIEGLRNGSAK
jgi:NitT/TauT family transport system ATP-binding protein